MFTFRVQVEGHLLLWLPGTGAAMGPRGRDDAFVRVVSTEHGNLAAKCASRGRGLSRGLIHYQRKDKIIGRALSERPQCILGPYFHGGRQLAVRLGTLVVHPNFDFLVKFLEEFERDVRDFKLADYVPCDERVKDLLCDVERRKVLHLKLESRSQSSKMLIS